MAARVMDFLRSPQYDTSGAYKIEGQTLEDGEQVRRRVILMPFESIRPIREAWSASDGTFSFTGLAAGRYIVLGIDKTANRNAVVYSYVDAAAM